MGQPANPVTFFEPLETCVPCPGDMCKVPNYISQQWGSTHFNRPLSNSFGHEAVEIPGGRALGSQPFVIQAVVIDANGRLYTSNALKALP